MEVREAIGRGSIGFSPIEPGSLYRGWCWERYNVVNLTQQSIMKAYELEAIVEADGKVQFPDFSIDHDSLF